VELPIEYLDPKEQEQQQRQKLGLSASFSSLPIIPYKNYLLVSQGSALTDTIYKIIAIRHYLEH